jgi:6-phosphogluconolactonase/glucosamine-6-phosphate isomerase/deaminase
MALKVFILRDYDGISDFASIYLGTDMARRTRIEGGDFNLGLSIGYSLEGLYKRLSSHKQNFDTSLMETWDLCEYVGFQDKPAHKKPLRRDTLPFSGPSVSSDGEKLKRYHIPMGYMIDEAELSAAINKGVGMGHVSLEGKRGCKAVVISPECRNDYLRGIDTMNKAYVKSIEDAGLIDWWLLGTGSSGNVGFHESGMSFDYDMFLAQLDEAARQKMVEEGRFMKYSETPQYAMTVGAGGVARLSKNVMLLAAGENRAESMAKSFFGPVTDDVPVSVLQRYIGREGSNAICVLDEAAAGEIIGRKKTRRLARKGITVTDMRQ